MTLFADVGEVLARKDGDTSDPHRRLAGWGIGAVYSLDRSLYARLDYARKIKGESYRSEAEDKTAGYGSGYTNCFKNIVSGKERIKMKTGRD